MSRVEARSKISIKIDQMPWPENTALTDKRNFVANIEKFQTYTRWKPLMEIEKGVDLLISAVINENSYEAN